MATDQASLARDQERHSHIGIRLQCLRNGHWVHVEALDWNARGFNFFHADPIAEDALPFKRGLTHFEGTLVWRRANADDDVVLGAIVNELIYKRAADVVLDEERRTRLLRLIRVSGMVEDKRRILASLGLDVPDARMAQLVAQRKQERPLQHYGVRVESAQWSEVVDKALQMASVITDLDRWAQSLGGKK